MRMLRELIAAMAILACLLGSASAPAGEAKRSDQ